MDEKERDGIKLGVILCDLLYWHEMAWLRGNKQHSCRFKSALKDVKQTAKKLSIPECTTFFNDITKKWDDGFMSQEHLFWVAIGMASTSRAFSGPVNIPLFLSKTAARLLFPSKTPRETRQLEKQLESRLKTDDITLSSDENLDMIADRVLEVCYPNADSKKQSEIRGLITALTSLIAGMLECREDKCHNKGWRFKDVGGTTTLYAHILLHSPVWPDMSSLLLHIAGRVQKADLGVWFAFGFHAGLLSTCPDYLPSCVTRNDLLLPDDRGFFTVIIGTGERCKSAIAELLLDELQKLPFTSRINQIVNDLVKEAHTPVRTPREFRSKSDRFMKAIDREYSLCAAPAALKEEKEHSIPKTEPHTEQPTLVDVKGVAKMMGLGDSTIYNWINSEKIPEPIRIGGVVKWERKEIENWIHKGCPPRRKWERTRGRKK